MAEDLKDKLKEALATSEAGPVPEPGPRRESKTRVEKKKPYKELLIDVLKEVTNEPRDIAQNYLKFKQQE